MAIHPMPELLPDKVIQRARQALVSRMMAVWMPAFCLLICICGW